MRRRAMLGAALLGPAAAIAAAGSTAGRADAQRFVVPPAGETMAWRRLPIGGGGFVTGVVVHPRAPDLVLARTDVGGLYRWSAATQGWRQLLTEASWPDGAVVPSVESVAIDPSDARIFYAALGATTATRGTFVKSTDGGQSWRTLPGPPVPVGGNEDFRWAGERLAVDPENGAVVLFGSRSHGLWLSENGGRAWRQVDPAAVPPGAAPAGVTFVAFDPRPARSAVHVGVGGQGVYRSGDGGRSWERLLADTALPQQAAVDAAGTLFVTFFGSGHGGAGKVMRLDAGGWRDITPAGGLDYAAITVDRAAAGRVWVATYPLTPDGVFHSSDGGGRWRRLRSTLADAPGWWPTWSLHSLAGGLAHDPRHPAGLWLTTGLGVLHTIDGAARAPVWRPRVDGLELTVAFDAVVTPGGAIVTAIADFDGFRHATLDRPPPAMHGRDRFVTTTSIAMMGGRRDVLVSVGADHHAPARMRAGYSTDGGRRWQDFPSLATGAHPAGLAFGNVAVSATDAANVVWQPTDGAPPYVTTDAGRSWHRLTVFDQEPFAGGAHSHLWNRQRALAADSVTGGVFYLYHHRPGFLMRSTDGGRIWAIASALPAGHWDTADLRAVPGRAGHLWLALGAGLYRSTDQGTSFRRDPSVARVAVLGFGAPAAGRAMPAAYIQGVVDGLEGIHRSIDAGRSWVRIGRHRAAQSEPRVIAGDLEVFGRVVLGTGGQGFLVGEVADR